MLFSDLLDLPYDIDTGRIHSAGLTELLPRTPIDVVEQVYADHGRNADFQNAYGALATGELRWHLRREFAHVLARTSMLDSFRSWFESVAARPREFAERS